MTGTARASSLAYRNRTRLDREESDDYGIAFLNAGLK